MYIQNPIMMLNSIFEKVNGEVTCIVGKTHESTRNFMKKDRGLTNATVLS